jgi:hypothetical protein
MPVHKFRDVAEIKDRWYAPGSKELAAAIRRVWDFARRTCPQRFPRGVFKHRTVEAASALRDEWERASFEQHQRRLRNG